MTMSMRRTIFILLGISLLVTVAIGVIGSHFTLKNAENISYQYENTTKPTFYLEMVKSNFWKAHAALLQAALDRHPAELEENVQKALALYRRNDELLRLYEKTEPSGPEETALYRTMVEKRRHFHILNAQTFDLVRLTTDDPATAAFNHYNNAIILPALGEFMSALDALNAHMLRTAEASNAADEATSRTAFRTMAAIIAMAVVLLLAAGFYFTAGVTRSINEAIGFATAIAEKDFDKPLDPAFLARRDEFGAMARVLQRMRENLIHLIGALNASNEAAQNASRHKSVFLSRMSHEIRTPLNAIIGMTYIAGKAADRETVNECLGKIATSSTHLLGLINDILDMSKIEAGKFELVEEEFGLEKLLMNVCTVASAKTEEKEQDLAVSLENGLGTRYIGDALRISQVLTNMLGNACKFTPVRGRIRLTAACVERNSLWSLVRFTVEDTGIGMTEEQIGRLFTPFEQADGGTSRQFGGTGLGLSICDKIVALMGGDIRVESEFGKGSKFVITLKLRNSERYEPARLNEGVDARLTRVLVVDKAEESRDFFLKLFAGLQVAAAAAENSDTALELLRANHSATPFNLVFLDWDTMGEEGVDFVKNIKAEFGGRVVVVLVSGFRYAEVERKAAEAGVNRFLPKPIFPSTVINLVNEVMGTNPEGAARAAEESAVFPGRRILLVEDNEINREIAFAYLENTEIVVDVAENGAEAVDKFLKADGAYDLVLMDVHMPVMDGYTASRRIRAEENTRGRPRTPIVAMTANAFKEDIARCLEAGMDDHVAKPMNADALPAMLRKYLNPDSAA